METAERPVMTATQFAECEAELGRLRALRAREMTERLRTAREFVSADANEEITHAQQDQAVLDARIRALEDLLREVTVIDESEGTDVVTVGCTVELEYLRTGRVVSLLVTGSSRLADARALSVRSPVGRAVIGRRVGDEVTAELPAGWLERLRIRAIGRPA